MLHAEKERKMKHKVIAGVTGIMFNVMSEIMRLTFGRLNNHPLVV